MRERLRQQGWSSGTAQPKREKPGSCAVPYLPDEDTVTLPFPTPPQGRQVGVKKVIIVIDDSPTIRAILKICLQQGGFEVEAFEDGITFFHWLTTPTARIPDLLFLDLILPKMDGYKVAQQVKAHPLFRKTILVFLSGKDSVLDQVKGHLVGAQSYLTKPFRTKDVLETARSLLGICSLVND
jgi:twitching motility two-component system response regulator PilG